MLFRSRENLLREGIDNYRIFVIGNPIYEVIQHYSPHIIAEKVLMKYKLKPNGYFLLTMNRAENVDHADRLANLIKAMEKIQGYFRIPVICSLHPRTRDKMKNFGISTSNPSIIFLKPLGFFDFIALEKSAFCVLSDSGTVQEECCIFKVPNVTIRDVTERPETIECGSNILSGVGPDNVYRAVKLVAGKPCNWNAPPEYLFKCVSDTVLRIVMGYSVSADDQLSYKPMRSTG